MSDSDISDYAKIREANIRRNEEFLQAVGLDNTSSGMRAEIAASKAASATKRGVTKKRKINDVVEPVRRSGRVTIDRLKSELADLDDKDPSKLSKAKELEEMVEKKKEGSYATLIEAGGEGGSSERYSRFEEEELKASPTNQPDKDEDEDEDEGAFTRPLFTTLASFSAKGSGSTSSSRTPKSKAKSAGTPKSPSTQTAESYSRSIAALACAAKDVAKVAEQRCTSVWVHPSETKLIVAAGDKSGNLGLWDVDAEEGGVGGVYKFKPAVSNICKIWSAPSDDGRMHVASYDGTVRFLDFAKACFVRSFESPDSMDDMYYTDLAQGSDGAGMWHVTRSDGALCCIDPRKSASRYAWKTELRIKSASGGGVDAGRMNSVQQLSEHTLLTAGSKSTICLYDVRKVGAALMPTTMLGGHLKSVNAAYASPDGRFIVSVSQDNTVKLWSDLSSDSAKCHTTRHDNHTGRWLSTFRPAWDPKQPSALCLGSMDQPRRVEVWSAALDASGKPVLSLLRGVRSDSVASVCSRNAFHPTLNIIAASNSSGRVHILR